MVRPEIAELYALLEQLRPTRAVRVNRAFAVSKAAGPAAGLALLDTDTPLADEYSYASLVRGSMLEELGRVDDARAAFTSALDRARNREEASQISARIERLDSRKRENDGI